MLLRYHLSFLWAKVSPHVHLLLMRMPHLHMQIKGCVFLRVFEFLRAVFMQNLLQHQTFFFIRDTIRFLD